MVAIPPDIRDQLGLSPQHVVEIAVQDGRMLVTPQQQPARKGLKARLATTRFDLPASKMEKHWLAMKDVGAELSPGNDANTRARKSRAAR